MNHWIFVVYFADYTADESSFEILRAFTTEKRAKEFVTMLTAAPFERHSLDSGAYHYKKVTLI
ncbi:hypothetical protein [Loigolactobacillus backii]|uniref:Uncharacterized protein n=1 Tax=Loigolactobacillus backii TaxID=375175 RepID=A0A192H1S8_9LACO|nr:hypothetical protein [Loigolactobacillus backii]ANK59670.1 hypothetical protein AYR52_05020 [Loigolactobacillus backii]ANK62764.1 hypothetical protein AYR53_08385 [Loigolactobacillus backii]ANK64665.1 hypothetical protein AYR54_05035 [Loigolactobacillus backii]ANK66939.1 hypothetical protein AYR55_04005 [Loigolactobacillus backii]ANK70228.1 hypothetical protein AYR56_08620 [Loigolactobacillus backii]